ncbi:MAG: hypothetical protein K9I34_06055 [Bacteroidales bacterium]|nr:hypothetical protein [Bacteroidales bacterium]
MNIYFNTPHALWLILLAAVLSAAYTWLFYRSDRKKSHFTSFWLFLLSAIRFVAVFILALLLLKPGIERIQQIEEKPIVVFVQDASSSVHEGLDSIQYAAGIAQTLREFSKEFIVHSYSVGDDLQEQSIDSLAFNQKSSNLSLVAEEIPYLFDGRNVAAVVFSSDGIYNQGNNPDFSFANFPFPLFTMGLGDPVEYPDIRINRLIANRMAFVDNEFPVDIELKGIHLPAHNFKIDVFVNGVKNTDLLYANTESHIVDVLHIKLKATEPGIAKLLVQVSALDDEKNIANNSASVLIEVMDKKQKVLLLANAPHPDITALRQSLESGKQVEVEVAIAGQPIPELADFNLIIMHQLPSATESMTAVLQTILKLQLPVLFITGTQTDLQKLNSSGFGALYALSTPTSEDAQAVINPDFSLFVPEQELSRQAAQWPPLTVPFSRLLKSPGQTILMYQKIKSVPTEVPLVAFYTQANQKMGLIGGEGIWRWKLYNYQQEDNHHAFEYLLNQMVQYLALKIQKERLKVNYNSIYQEGESIIFSAEVYNPSYELITTPELRLNLQNKQGKQFDYVFGLEQGNYMLDAGSMPEGNYTFIASTQLDGVELRKSGAFAVNKRAVETLDLRANHELLRKMAEDNQGKFYLPSNLSQLQQDILELKDSSRVIREEKTKTDFIAQFLILALLILLFGIEWFARKYHGAY